MAEVLALGPDTVPCVEPLVGRYVTMLDDCRTLTMETIKSLRFDLLYWRRNQFDSNISDLLYHIALVEADWLFVDVLERSIPEELSRHLAYDDRDEQGRLVHIGTEELEATVVRLTKVRAALHSAFSTMDLAEFRRLRKSGGREVSPEWVLHHLLQHEAEPRGQINLLKRLGSEAARKEGRGRG